MPNSRATMETIGAPAGGPHGAGQMNFRAILSSRVHMWRMGKGVVNKTNEAMTATAAVTWSAGEHRVPAHSTTLINQVPGLLRLLQTCAQHAEGENTARRSNKPTGPAWPMPPKYGAKTAHEFKHLIPVWSKPDARISSALRVAVSLKAEGRGVRDRRGDETRQAKQFDHAPQHPACRAARQSRAHEEPGARRERVSIASEGRVLRIHTAVATASRLPNAI